MRKRKIAGFLVVFVLGISVRESLGHDWPQWRGPERDAISPEKGLLAQWPDKGPPLVWKARALGRGYSSVAVAGGRIFTMGDRRESGSEGRLQQFVVALAESDGKELWSARVGEPYGDGGPRCTPTVAGSLVYARGPHGDLVCLEAAGGAEKWRKNLARDFEGRMMSGWAYSESPLVDGDKVVCTPGGA